MSASDINIRKYSAGRTALNYLLISLFLVLFGAVYEAFSHEVYSYYMIYAFVFPLLFGTLPFLALSLEKTKKQPGAFCRSLYHAGVAALSVGSVFRGVLEIYGTTNALINVYWYAGAVLILSAVLLYVVSLSGRQKAREEV